MKFNIFLILLLIILQSCKNSLGISDDEFQKINKEVTEKIIITTGPHFFLTRQEIRLIFLEESLSRSIYIYHKENPYEDMGEYKKLREHTMGVYREISEKELNKIFKKYGISYTELTPLVFNYYNQLQKR